MAQHNASRTRRMLPGPGPAQRYAHGNLLVQQMRSYIGRDEAQIETLRTLNLGKIGRSAICDISQRSVREQLRSLDFLLAVAPLTLDAAAFGGAFPGGDFVDTPAARGDRRDFVAGDHGFAYVVHDGDATLVAWSSAIPISTTLRRLQELGLDVDGDPAVIVEGERVIDVASGRSAISRLLFGPATADFVRIGVEGLTLAWSPAAFPTHVDHDFDPGRTAVRFRAGTLDVETLERVIKKTATPEIALHAARIADAASR